MVDSDGRGKGLENKPAGDRRRCENSSTTPFFFIRPRYRTSKPVFRRSSVSLLLAVTGLALALFGDGATAAAAAAGGGGGRDSVRDSRAGNVAGLEDGRISLSKVTKMLTSSVHMELAGSEDAFRRLLDHEWERFSSRPDGTRSTFVVCSAAGRKNAKRLRDLAGADSLVETLYHKKGEPLCSVASLDPATAALVAAEGDAETFSLEPLPHLAKLAPAVAVDPSAATMLLSSEAVSSGGTKRGAKKEAGGPAGESGSREGEGGGGGGGGGRRLRAGAAAGVSAGGDAGEAGRRERMLAEAVAERPATRRLIEDGVRGRVDAIEITLALHHERRSKSETEELARGWISSASDQASLVGVLREGHFWGQEQEEPNVPQQVEQEEAQEEQGGKEEQEEGVDGSGEEGGGEGRRLAGESLRGATEEERKRARELAAHEERKRLGWAGLLDDVEQGQGLSSKSADAQGVGGGGGGRQFASCGFDLAKFTVSPSGKKVLLHRPHEIAAAAAGRGGGGGGSAVDDGCLSALLAFVSLQPEVHYVTARRKTATMNLDAAWVTQSGVDGYTPLWDEDLQGQDEIIGVADTGVDMNHCHFSEDDGDSIEASDWESPTTDLTKRKVVQYIQFVDDFDEEGGHGTHVAGSIAGAQSGDEAGSHEADGMAFQGKLAVFDFGDSDNNNALTTPDQVDEIMLQPAYDGGARVHSNSWDTVSVEYTSISKEVDEFVYTHQDFLVVFAAGNCGDTSATDDFVDNCDVLDDDEGTVLSPAQAKNVVAVGSSESAGVANKDEDTVSYFSSKGPTIDGRIKPDVVAPGDPTWSAYADPTGTSCEFGSQTGTSMSTPIVAGNGAMARQYFREGWYNTGSKNLTLGFDPSAALLKAVLINSATAMSFAGVNPEASSLDVTLTDPPDNHQGHGRVTMINALNINSTVGIFFEDWVEISEGMTLEYEVSLYEDADLDKDLRVTLVWTDPAASTGSTSALIHDLDLVVIAQSTGTEYYPNGGDEADTVNNVEKVIITDTTEMETYTIRVICDELSDADIQYFAVIANGEFIKTNALPTTPEPSDWLDLVDQAAASILTWKFGAALALGFAACCAISCACRRCQRNRRHVVLQHKYSRNISANRGGVSGGRKLRPPTNRPQPYAFPMRAPGDPSAAGSGRFQESWRRPGPSSEHSRRSMRSGHSARGALLTGAGAVVPAGIDSEATTPPTPPHETCPECGLRLPDVFKLVNHVETHHGGRAIRKKEKAAAAALEAGAGAGGAKAGAKTGGKAAGRRGESPVVASAKDARKSSPPNPAEGGRGSPNARAARARSSSKTRSESPAQAHVSAVRSSTAAVATAVAVGTVVVTAVPVSRRKATAPPAEPPSRSYPDPAAAAAAAAAASSATKSRSKSPGISGSGRSGSSSAKTRSASSGSNDPAAAAPTRGRDALPRLKDISGHGASKHARDQDSSGHGSGGSSDPLPRVLPRVKDRGRSAGGDSDELPRILPRVKDGSGHATSKDRKNSGSAGASPAAPARGSNGRAADVRAGAAAASKLPATKTDYRQGARREVAGAGSRGTRPDRNGSSPPLENRRNGDSGGSRSRGTSRDRGGSGSRGTSRERGRPHNADKGKPSEERGRSRGRSRQRALAPALDGLRGLAREDSTRSLARTASLDRMSALSSRALTRLNRGDGEGDAAVGSGGGGGGGGGASGGAKGAAARKKEEALSRRGIRRIASTEDMVPAGQRLTADRLRHLGSGLATEFTVPPPVFSPVKGSGKEPAYSPVARGRAAELDEDRPVSLTRKFFRQLSGEL